jgi:hypothetical protein
MPKENLPNRFPIGERLPEECPTSDHYRPNRAPARCVGFLDSAIFDVSRLCEMELLGSQVFAASVPLPGSALNRSWQENKTSHSLLPSLKNSVTRIGLFI